MREGFPLQDLSSSCTFSHNLLMFKFVGKAKQVADIYTQQYHTRALVAMKLFRVSYLRAIREMLVAYGSKTWKNSLPLRKIKTSNNV